MSIVVDVMRPFWMHGLNDISGVQLKGVAGWISDEEYQIYTEPQPQSFRLNIADPEPLLRGYAADINRLGSASFETIDSIIRLIALPKSLAWLVIKTYYAAFFAAHALLRMFGVSCSSIERAQVNSIVTIAEAYGFTINSRPSAGLYKLVFVQPNGTIDGVLLESRPHEALWVAFSAWVVQLSTDVLQAGIGTS
jgi:hypothetical protein